MYTLASNRLESHEDKCVNKAVTILAPTLQTIFVQPMRNGMFVDRNKINYLVIYSLLYW